MIFRKLSVVFIINLFLVFSLSTIHASPKPKIGIMKFEVTENVNPAVQEFLYAQLLEQMVQSGKYTVVDWEEIDRLLQYIASSQPNVSEEDARQQAVNQLGIEKMYLGSVAKIGSKYHLSVKVLNLDLSVDRTASEYASNEDDLDRAIKYVSQLLMASPEKAKKIKAEKETWRELQSNKSEQALKNFLNKYPGGVYAEPAQEALDKMISENKKKEATKVKEIEEKKKQTALCDRIAGPWQLTAEPAIYEGNKFVFIPNGRIIIHQKGNKISFEHKWQHLMGSGQTTYSGTYEGNYLTVESHKTFFGGRWQISASMEDDCMTLQGSGQWGSNQSSLIMKRLDADVDPLKYSNYKPMGGWSAFCFISTLLE
jgi:hypothetical protein